jgi:hypothetical protein
MSDRCYLHLYTKNPEDLAKVSDFARQIDSSDCLDLTDRCLSWLLYDEEVDYEELTRTVARQFPEIDFVLIFDQPSQLCWTEFEWDGEDWQESGWYSDYEEAGTDNKKSFLYTYSEKYGPSPVEALDDLNLEVNAEADEDLPF